MDIDDVRFRAQAVRDAADDPEAAHGMLDELWEDVLRVVADGQYGPDDLVGLAMMARLALGPVDDEEPVRRWYA